MAKRVAHRYKKLSLTGSDELEAGSSMANDKVLVHAKDREMMKLFTGVVLCIRDIIRLRIISFAVPANNRQSLCGTPNGPPLITCICITSTEYSVHTSIFFHLKFLSLKLLYSLEWRL